MKTKLPERTQIQRVYDQHHSLRYVEERISNAILSVYERLIVAMLTTHTQRQKQTSIIARDRTASVAEAEAGENLTSEILMMRVYKKLRKKGFLAGVENFEVNSKEFTVTVSPNWLRMEFKEFMVNPTIEEYVDSFERKFLLGKHWKHRTSEAGCKKDFAKTSAEFDLDADSIIVAAGKDISAFREELIEVKKAAVKKFTPSK